MKFRYDVPEGMRMNLSRNILRYGVKCGTSLHVGPSPDTPTLLQHY